MDNNIFNPYNSAEILKDGKRVGVIGELHPRVLREHKFIRVDKVKAKLYYLEIDIESLK
jgi:phenylalanyl-tRNA synthetase beta subunit